MEGTAYLLAGQPERADPILAHAVEVVIHLGGAARRFGRPGRALRWAVERSPAASLKELALASDVLSDAP
jgi:hypothetical protein